MRSALITVIILSAAICAAAQRATLLPDTKGAQRVLDYFTAFNSSDEQKLRNFFAENITDESLKQRPVEPRMEFHKQVKRTFQTLEIKTLVSAAGGEIKLLAQSVKGGWIEYVFTIEDQPAQKIVMLTLEPMEPPVTEVKVSYPAPANGAEFLKTAEKYLDELAKSDAFSGVVLVAKDDKPIFSKAYGLASKEHGISNRPDTKFNLGSINKTFTRVAIGQLVQQGKISFDDKLGKYLPDYPNREAAEKITVRHLVTMRSGIGDFTGDKYFATAKDRFRTNSDFIPLFANEPLAFEPGTKDLYSNGGYILLGAIIEKVTGKSYYDYVRENIFKPAAMLNTESYETDKMPVNTASGYTRSATQNRVNNIFTLPARGCAAGGGYSTAEDLLMFSAAVKSGKLIIPDGDGRAPKDTTFGIAGGAEGINAIFMVNAQSGYTVIVLSNYDPPSAEQSGKQLRDWLKQIQQ